MTQCRVGWWHASRLPQKGVKSYHHSFLLYLHITQSPLSLSVCLSFFLSLSLSSLSLSLYHYPSLSVSVCLSNCFWFSTFGKATSERCGVSWRLAPSFTCLVYRWPRLPLCSVGPGSPSVRVCVWMRRPPASSSLDEMLSSVWPVVPPCSYITSHHPSRSSPARRCQTRRFLETRHCLIKIGFYIHRMVGRLRLATRPASNTAC